jgi:peptide/nickel transport system substrate-binding protein
LHVKLVEITLICWYRSSGNCSGAALALVCMLLAACGGARDFYVDNAPPDDPGEPLRGGSIIVGLEGETNSWLPGRGNFAAAGLNVAAAIYDPLIARSHDLELRPYLAESIQPNGDFSEWTLRLRPGVLFHDGTPLDAAALKWNFDHLHKVPGAVTFGAVRDIERVEIVDGLTVRYHLSRGIAPFPDLLTGPIGWPYSPTAAQRLGEDAGARPVGTGPFQFVNWRRDDRLVVRRFDRYWQQDLPHLDEIVFRPLPDEDTRLASLVSRDIDAMQTLRQSIVDQLRRTPGIHRYEFIGNSGGGSIFNTQRPPVDDARIRRSLAYAVSQEALIEVLGGLHITPPQTQYFSETSPWYSERVARRWPQGDMELARELLTDYMYDADRSDGRAPGAPVAIEFLCLGDPSLMELSQMYQAFWRAVGYEVRLRQIEQATQIQVAMNGDYMITCWRAGGQADPYITLSNAFGPPDEEPLNYTNFEHPVVAENLDVLRTETDFGVRYDAVERIMLLFTEQVPNLWTASTPVGIGVRPELRNIDGWRFPDGTLGDGIPGGMVMWGHVWRAGP